MRAFLAPLLAIALVFTSVASGVGELKDARAARQGLHLQSRSDGEPAIIASGSGPSRSQLTAPRSGKRGLFHPPLLLVLPARPCLVLPAPESTTYAIPLFVLQQDVGHFHHPARAPPCPAVPTLS